MNVLFAMSIVCVLISNREYGLRATNKGEKNSPYAAPEKNILTAFH